MFSASLYASDKSVLTISHAYFEPYIWSENGFSKGIYVDILKEAIENRLGITVKFNDYPWKRAQKRVKNGYEDAFVTLSTPKRLKYTTAGNIPLLVTTLGVFTYVEHPQFEQMKGIHTISDLKPYRILSYAGDGLLENEFASFDVDYGAYDLIAALKKLQKKRGDILIETTEVTHYTIKKLNLKNKIIEVPNVKIETLEFKLLISKKSPFTYLIPKIDNVLIEMESDGTLDAIYKKYR